MSSFEIAVMTDDKITRHFFNGFIRLHVLFHAANDAVYGAEIVAELIRHGYRVSQGTLYPTLHALEQHGYLRRENRLIEGRWRKYYHATASGRRVLKTARRMLQELVAEILEDRHEPFERLRAKARPKRGGRR